MKTVPDYLNLKSSRKSLPLFCWQWMAKLFVRKLLEPSPSLHFNKRYACYVYNPGPTIRWYKFSRRLDVWDIRAALVVHKEYIRSSHSISNSLGNMKVHHKLVSPWTYPCPLQCLTVEGLQISPDRQDFWDVAVAGQSRQGEECVLWPLNG